MYKFALARTSSLSAPRSIELDGSLYAGYNAMRSIEAAIVYDLDVY